MKTKKTFFSLILILSGFQLLAQDSLLKSLNDSMPVAPNSGFVTGTFKALYIVNMKTIEAPAGGALNVEIQHRFGTINTGAYNLWGLDFATLRLGLDYGITDRLSVGIGRSSYLETFDGYLKYKLLRQTESSNASISWSAWVLRVILQIMRLWVTILIFQVLSRFNYTSQMLIARKFNSHFSLELTPTFIHYNMVDSP